MRAIGGCGRAPRWAEAPGDRLLGEWSRREWHCRIWGSRRIGWLLLCLLLLQGRDG
jgi:hypothetical protein